jgi:hypothetical protein
MVHFKLRIPEFLASLCVQLRLAWARPTIRTLGPPPVPQPPKVGTVWMDSVARATMLRPATATL